jgi:CHASE3 domain sensor protein
MVNELDLTDDQVKDGLALYALTQDEKVWPALQRVLKQMHDDAIAQWLSDEKGGKKLMKGYRQCLSDIQSRIAERAQEALAHVENKKMLTDAERSMVDDGGKGVGEMAIA